MYRNKIYQNTVLHAFLGEGKNKLGYNIEPTRTTLNFSFENYVFISLPEKAIQIQFSMALHASVNDVLRLL